MNTPHQLQDLVAEIVHLHPSAQLELDPLPSGVCFLRLALNGREFVLEFDPKRGAGVSENFPDTPPFVGHDEAYDSLDRGIARFQELLASAASVAAEPMTAFALHDKLVSN